MEIFSYHEASGKWLEVGNSGVFRPEMVRPMGLPDDVGVIAWGLSLERPTMIKYGISNIRDLFGHKVSPGVWCRPGARARVCVDVVVPVPPPLFLRVLLSHDRARLRPSLPNTRWT